MFERTTRSGSRFGSRAASTALAAIVTGTIGWSGMASAAPCLGDAVGDSGLNCTANDIGVASVTVTQVIDGCDFNGDTFTFNGTLNMGESNASRYDLGFYIG
ncbi:MAG: hypothetical protein ABR587_06415, partial [Candidatus Binatia bacterium]